MDWETSQCAAEYSAKAGTDAKRRAVDLVSAFLLRTVFGAGLAHADPNPGNFGFRMSGRDAELVVYDYGSVAELPEGLPAGLLDLIRAVRAGEDPFHRLLSLGFAPEPLEPIRTRLLPFCELIFAPFLANRPFDVGAWNRKEKAAALLGAQRWNFMLAAPVGIFPLLRAFHGLTHYAALFGAPLHLGPALDALPVRQATPQAPPLQARAPLTAPAPEGVPAAGRKLRVEVEHNGSATVSLTFPGGAVDRLPSLLDPELLARIAGRGIDLEEIMAAARRGGYAPMPLFACGYEGKSVRVWLE